LGTELLHSAQGLAKLQVRVLKAPDEHTHDVNKLGPGFVDKENLVDEENLLLFRPRLLLLLSSPVKKNRAVAPSRNCEKDPSARERGLNEAASLRHRALPGKPPLLR